MCFSTEKTEPSEKKGKNSKYLMVQISGEIQVWGA